MARIPASIRNRNPGAMWPGKSATKFGSTSFEKLNDGLGQDNKIATFPTAVQGAAAQMDLLASPAYSGRPMKEAITKWCGNNFADSYLAVLEAQGGVTRSTMLTRDWLAGNPDACIALCKAMARQEAGQDFPMSDADWQQAHALAFPDPPMSAAPVPAVFSPDNDVPSPKPEARVIQTAKESKTIKGAAVGLIGGLIAAFNEAVSVGLDAATQVSQWKPIEETFPFVKGVGVILLVGGVVLVIYRRLTDAANGRA